MDARIHKTTEREAEGEAALLLAPFEVVHVVFDGRRVAVGVFLCDLLLQTTTNARASGQSVEMRVPRANGTLASYSRGP
jgi:hypothetical protein